jgi:Rrf2 family protein
MKIELQRKTELALRTIRLLAARGNTIQGAALATAIGTTPNFLAQVISPLIEAGWVTSGRGPTGGYRLVEPADHITMLALIEASEGPLPTDKCVLEDGPCSDQVPCALHDSWQQVQEVVLTQLNRMPVLQSGELGEMQ